MPILKIQTNQEIKHQENVLKETSLMLAELLQKPEKYIMILLEKSEMLFAGENSLCLYAELKSIGLPTEKTNEFSEVLCSFFEKHFGVSSDRIYIEFTNSEKHMLGWNNKTFL
ncbi:MAG: phenylpyruvate tautomerase MIF-related protein [Candidatus Paceibacterota bacterium]